MLKPQPIRFTLEEAQACSDAWGFNCGPAAACAIANLTPKEVRPYLWDFESKKYTNPSLMKEILNRLGVQFRQVYRSDNPVGWHEWTGLSLMRVQFGGPWTRPGVPMRVRYRMTHWVAVGEEKVFDVNAMCVGGWLPWVEWATQLVPWLIKECYPKADGTWWPTHVHEILDIQRI